MKFGNMSLERSTETRNAGPLDVVTTTWSGHVGKARWSRSRATRVFDTRTGKTERVGTARRAAMPSLVAAVASGAAGLLAKGVRTKTKD